MLYIYDLYKMSTGSLYMSLRSLDKLQVLSVLKHKRDMFQTSMRSILATQLRVCPRPQH